jgi:hypothetical protein
MGSSDMLGGCGLAWVMKVKVERRKKVAGVRNGFEVRGAWAG